ncbi:hypothetical protein SAPIO_CDS9883 [Scedosporium apiospermum]|uniref:Uncharacterized protein n=1 Tax=Pseudallescheria apiosperma TaxID=563466 RepID=A0A084FVV6_PSEDA|nr:uncharacterized protein SAPIO_CDS9883 [Scedosporium apiospermum]KEZ39218.1 hypothetical protein SAPIO_CDS9883 [Scedosporium apiospermum]
MTSLKDMRRVDLVVPYQEPQPRPDEVEFSSTLSSTLPMAAMMTRNRFIGWASFVFSLQSWLGQSEQARRNASMPGYFSAVMAFLALVIVYLPIFLPPNIKQHMPLTP